MLLTLPPVVETEAVNWWLVAQRVCLGALGLMVVFGLATMVYFRSPSPGGAEAGLTEGERRRAVILTQYSVRIEADTCDGRVTGSGFLFDGHLITNHHVVEGASHLEVLGVASPQAAVVLIERSSPSYDLARAGSVPSWATHVELEAAPSDPELGAPVVVAGWVEGRPQWREAVVHLYVSGHPYGSEGTVMLIDPGMPQGFSGGPVLDRNGRVVGVQRAVDRATDLALVVPLSELESWLSNPLNEDPQTSCI